MSPVGLLEPVNCPNCDSVFSSLELEQRETSRLTKENKALVNGIFQLQTEVCFQQELLFVRYVSYCLLIRQFTCLYLTNRVMGITVSIWTTLHGFTFFNKIKFPKPKLIIIAWCKCESTIHILDEWCLYLFIYNFLHYILQVATLQTQLKEKTDTCDSLSKQLSVTASQSEERAASIDILRQELDHLKLAKVVLTCDLGTAV